MNKLGLRLTVGLLGALGTAAVAPAPASAAPAAAPHVSYRAGLEQNFALSAGGGWVPVAMVKYDFSFGSSDWRKEPTVNGFRLHSRFWRDYGGADVCLAASGTQVLEEPCTANNNSLRQNWTLEPVNGFHRLRHGFGKYLTYPTSGNVRAVFLAGPGLQQTQILTERPEGVK